MHLYNYNRDTTKFRFLKHHEYVYSKGVVCNQCNFIAYSFYGNCYCNVVVDLAPCLSDKGNKLNGFFQCRNFHELMSAYSLNVK